jgi:hypothetical protein
VTIRLVRHDLVRHDTDTPTVSGPAANARLTGWAGAALFVLLAVEGATILNLRRMLVVHVVVGLMLIGPLMVKLSSTGYRFLRYSTGERSYVAAGLPPIPLRLLAPVLIVATLFVLGTGVSLLFASPAVREAIVAVHRASFVAWFAVAAGHVLAYVWRIPRLIAADVAPSSGPAFRRGWAARLATVTAALLVGVLLADLLVQRVQPWLQVIQQPGR